DFVGCSRAGRDRQMLDLVRAGQMSGSVIGHTATDRVPRTAIEDKFVAQRQDMPIAVEPDLDLVQLVARMGRALEMLVPVLDPAPRPPQPARQKRDHQILGVDMTFEAEPATDIECQTPHSRFWKAEDRGHLSAHPMHDLSRGPNRYCIGPRVVNGGDTAAL